MRQATLFKEPIRKNLIRPFNLQLLKWVGNKQRFAHEIVAYFPNRFGTYFEPFLGSGGVLGSLAPQNAVASDSFQPLMKIWQTLQNEPETLKRCYEERWELVRNGNKREVYEKIKASYNCKPNAADLLFICRSCYGGVVRFRQADGYISTPVGIHDPISPQSFSWRVEEWHHRTKGTQFIRMEYEEAMSMARAGDMVYCDPPYSHSQAILYGAQSFSLARLFETIEKCKSRGVFVALSIDGSKRSGNHLCKLPVPEGLFERELFISIGRSMLKRFQMNGSSLEHEEVADRLLLTY
jgi:DNA adenine methylase